MLSTRLSSKQFAVLKWLLSVRDANHVVRINAITISSLTNRGYLCRNGSKIFVTKTGIDAYNSYHSPGISSLQVHKDTWDNFKRSQRILHAIQNLRKQKAA